MVDRQNRSGSAGALAATLFSFLPICTAVSRAQAQDMDKQTENRVRQAAVQVWMGEAKQGEEQRNWLGSGSGSFINRTGLVVTNNHVVDPGHGKSPIEKFQLRYQYSVLKYRVIINGGTEAEKEYEAIVNYQNESADLSILQVLTEGGEPLATPEYLTLQPSDSLQEGDPLWCFGFPGGDKMSTSKDKHAPVSVSKGNIIGLPRTPGGRIPRIDTDVKAAPGNSGGPLVNADGKTIGILSQGGMTNDSGDGIVVRIIPADLVSGMVKVGIFLGKIRADADLEPFLNLLTDKDGRVFLPGMERDAQKSVIRFTNGDALTGAIVDKELTWKSPFGEIKVPVKLAAYAVGEDGKINLLLDGGDRLSANSGDVSINFLPSRGGEIKQTMTGVAKLAFVKPDHQLVAPNIEATMIDGEGCRIVLTDLTGEVKFKTETRSDSLALDEIKRVETKAFKQVLTTVDGTVLTGAFEPHQITAKLAWTGTPVTISLEKVKFATIRHGNPAKAGRARRSLAQRLIDDQNLVNIANLLEKNELKQASELINAKLAKTAFKALPEPVQDQVKLLEAELFLRQGQYGQAKDGFKKLRRAVSENVKWHAASRFEMLDRHPDGKYNGASLSDAGVFATAAEELAATSVASARATLRAYANAMPDKHSGWKDLVRQLENHEEELQLADSLDPGRAENDIFRIWRFSQDLNNHEFQRLTEERNQLQRKIDDFKDDRTPASKERRQGLITKLERFEEQATAVGRSGEDNGKKMGSAGFRLDDPAAAEILN